MAVFFAAVEGDPLDSGGKSQVIEGVPCVTIEGADGQRRRMAMLGHRAWCDACKSAGIIVPAPGSPHQNRMLDFTSSSGQRQALGGDLVMCKCKRHPRIVPIHGHKWVVHPDSPAAGVSADAATFAASSFAASSPASPNSYDQHFVLIDAATGEPASGFAYGLETPDGPCEGCTGEDGRTESVHSDHPATVTLSWVLQTEIGIRK